MKLLPNEPIEELDFEHINSELDSDGTTQLLTVNAHRAVLQPFKPIYQAIVALFVVCLLL